MADRNKESALDYMAGTLKNGMVSQFYGDEDDAVDSAFYLKSQYDESIWNENANSETQDDTYIYDVLQWVLFQQHNEGYWGDSYDEDEDDNSDSKEDDYTNALTEQLANTALVSTSLLASGFNRTSESIVDAQKWVSREEDKINKSSGKALGAALYLVQQNAYPLLYAIPSVIVIDKDSTDIEIMNPTPFKLRDLTYELSPELENLISVDEKTSIAEYSYRKITFTKKGQVTNSVPGIISIKNADQEIGRIPVIVLNAPTLDITLPKSISIFGNKGNIPISIKGSKNIFTCNVKFEHDELSNTEIRVKVPRGNIPLNFGSAITKEDYIDGEIICVAEGYEFNFPISLLVSRFEAEPLTVLPDSISISEDGQKHSLMIKNNLDDDYKIDIMIDNFESNIILPEGIYIEAGEAKNLTFMTSFDSSLNYSGTSTITFSAFNRDEIIDVNIDVMASVTDKQAMIRLITILIFILVIIGGLGTFAYMKRKDINIYINKIPFFQSKEEIKEKKESLDNLRVDDRNKAIVTMYHILRFKHSKDNEILKKLQTSFDKEEIQEALEKEGIDLDYDDEDGEE